MGAMRELDESVDFLRRRGLGPAVLGVVLGSGLGQVAERGPVEVSVAFGEIPHFRIPGAEGHPGRMVLTQFGGVRAAVLQGRLHYYEGYSLQETVFPLRVLLRLGVRALVVTCAAGGLNPEWEPGELMAIVDHLNFMGDNPLRGPNLEEMGPRFPSLVDAYSPVLLKAAEEAASRLGLVLRRGVYAAVSGPSYETLAEARFLRWAGADAVGMSTVPEVIVARHAGVAVLGLACITNSLCREHAPDHREVLAVARAAAERLGHLLEESAAALVGGAGGGERR